MALKPILDTQTNTQEPTNLNQDIKSDNANNVESVQKIDTVKYPFELKVGDKTYHFRKWKVKDLKAYRDLGKDTGVFEKHKARDILVKNLFAENVIFDVAEYTYALLMIKENSISNKIHYKFNCTNCNEDYDYEADFREICKLKSSGYGKVQTTNHVFEFCDLCDAPKNLQEYYELKLDDENKEDFVLTDALCHIKSVDDKEMKPSELFELFDDMEMDEFTEVMTKYDEMKFKLEFTHDVQCPHCNHVVSMIFDEMPELIPKEFMNPLERKMLSALQKSSKS